MEVTVLLLALSSVLSLATGRAAVPPRTTANTQSTIGNRKSPAAIAIPQLLSYQGRLTDSLGVPVVDSAYSVGFRLYTSPSGGSPFWAETQNVATRNGLFSMLLGSVTPIDSVPGAGTAYLAMTVSGGPELTPRIRVGSAAFAYLSGRAASADLLQGKDTAALDGRYVNEGQAGSLTSAMMVDGTIAAADLGPMGASTGQVMKWTGSAWAPRNDSFGSGSGPVRGSDIVKPCTLAASVASPNAILHVRNDGTGVGMRVHRAMDGVRVDTATMYGLNVQQANVHGVLINNATTAGLYVQRTGLDGAEIWRAPQYGVFVDSAGSAGLNVTRAELDGVRVHRALDGVHVDTATQYGLNVQQANTHGVLINNANNVGLYVQRAGLDGAEIWRTPYNGLYVDSAGVAGIRVHRAIDGVLADTVQYGLYVQRASTHGVAVRSAGQVGLYVERAAVDGAEFLRSAYCGVLVDSAGWDGVRVNRSDSSGLRVRHAMFRGVHVDTSNNDGLHVGRASTSGAYVGNAGTRGVWVDSSGQDGLFVNRAGTNGVYVHRAHSYGLRVDTASTAGTYVDRVGAYAHKVHYAWLGGLSIDTCGVGVGVQWANWAGVEVASSNTWGVRAVGNAGGGLFYAGATGGSGIEAHALGDTTTKTAVKAFGKGLATGGWSTGFKDGSEAPAVVAGDRMMIAAGSSRLSAGGAAISLPDGFTRHVRSDVPVRLSVTPTSDAPGLLVAEPHGTGTFSVRLRRIAGLDGSENATFDWLAVGILKEPGSGSVIDSKR